MRTDQISDQLNMIQDQSQDSAYAWADIQIHTQQINDLSFDIEKLEGQIDHLQIITAEAGGHLNEPIFQEMDGIWDAINNLGNGGFDEWEIDELDTRLTVLETTIYNQPDNRWEIDELLRRVNELEWFTYG